MEEKKKRKYTTGDMATAENARKIRLLKLWKLLEQKTDPDNALSTKEILTELNNMGLLCDRRTLSKDIAILNEYGFEVMTAPKGHSKAYYVDDRAFQVSEVRLLMDAVRSARFITENKTKELTKKIAKLAGDYRADLFTTQTLLSNTPKHSNEQIYYNIDTLSEAIIKKVKVRLKYFHLDEKKQKIYHHNQNYYIISPITLQYSNDQYYLVGCCDNDENPDKLIHYRLDRMEKVELLDVPIDAFANVSAEKLEKYPRQIFSMYGGEFELVTLEFRDNLIGVIYDKFGEDVNIHRIKDSICSVTVEVQISPTFFGWVFQFAEDMKIIKPVSLVNEYRARCMKVFNEHENHCQNI